MMDSPRYHPLKGGGTGSILAAPLFTQQGRWARPGFSQRAAEKLLGSTASAPADHVRGWRPGHLKAQPAVVRLRGLPGRSPWAVRGWRNHGGLRGAVGLVIFRERAYLVPSLVTTRVSPGSTAGIRGGPPPRLCPVGRRPAALASRCANTRGSSADVMSLPSRWEVTGVPFGQLLLYGRHPVAW